MTKIIIAHFNKNGIYTSDTKNQTDDFFNENIETILINHHKKNSDSSIYSLNNDKLSTSYSFLITQNLNLMKELKLKLPIPKKTLDLFINLDLSTIKISHLLQDLDRNQADFQTELDNRYYSFRLVRGKKALNLTTKVEGFFEQQLFQNAEKNNSRLKNLS